MATHPTLPQRQTEPAREQITTSGPSARYLQARIAVLRDTLLSRLEDILALCLTHSSSKKDDSDAADRAPTPPPPSLVEIVDNQLMVDTATNSMIRAIEEFMVLTRTMKELWLFGGLDTLDVNLSEEEKEKRRKLREDEEFVVGGMQEWLRRNGHALSKENSDAQLGDEGENEHSNEDEDEDNLQGG